MTQLSFISLNKLIDDQQATKEDIDFITHQLSSYASQEKELFNFSEDVKKIFRGDYHTYLIRNENRNILLLLFDIRTAASGNDFLYVHLLTGDAEGQLQDIVYFIDDFLTKFCKHFNLSFILFNGRPGWDKFFNFMDVRKKYITYAKEIN